MWQFLLGVLIGANLGFLIHCLFIVNKGKKQWKILLFALSVQQYYIKTGLKLSVKK